ncbi:uncharacterized protein LOC143793142 isoform X2 [Ranitomeya variabilis]|uniref:uncharacterized protein LOC143793142 isoform X2 n=1 Tax=Ranitomeya variabilis TaxID=490064 RepID=UPI0040569EEE
MTLHSFLENIKILETETGSFSSRHLSFPSSTPDPAAPSSLLPGILVTSPRCSAFTFRPAVSQCGKRMARDLTDTGMNVSVLVHMPPSSQTSGGHRVYTRILSPTKKRIPTYPT